MSQFDKVKEHPVVFAAIVAVASGAIVWKVIYNVQVEPRDLIISERNREIADLRSEHKSAKYTIDELREEGNRAQSTIDELARGKSLQADYGPDIWFYKSFIVDRAAGADLEICLAKDCFTANISPVTMYQDPSKDRPGPVVDVMVNFPKGLAGKILKGIGVKNLRLTAGSWSAVYRSDYDYKILVEAVRFDEVRLGFAIRRGSIQPGPEGEARAKQTIHIEPE